MMVSHVHKLNCRFSEFSEYDLQLITTGSLNLLFRQLLVIF
jgi:hypothetical protein